MGTSFMRRPKGQSPHFLRNNIMNEEVKSQIQDRISFLGKMD